MSQHVTQENHFYSHLLSSISFITITQTPLVNSNDHRKLHKPMGFGHLSTFLLHQACIRRNATECQRWFVAWQFRKSLLETTETHKHNSSPNTRNLHVSLWGKRGAHPAMLVEPCAEQEWLWPESTRDSLDPLRPFCWDAVAKPWCVLGLLNSIARVPHTCFGEGWFEIKVSLGVYLFPSAFPKLHSVVSASGWTLL